MNESDFKDIGRDTKRCFAIWRVRINHNMPVLTDENRFKFMLLTLAELHPNSKLGRFVNDQMYENKDAFEQELKSLTSIATLERDNRALESKGRFMKEKDLPKVPANTLFTFETT